MLSKPNIVFFGTPDRAVIALDVLQKNGIVPALIITQPDRPSGRKLVLTPPPVKVWAESNNIPCLQPNDLSHPDFIKTLTDGKFDVFVVVAYGKILKSDILTIPKFGSINLHASLLPALRGSCPIETAILTNTRETGATIILMDEKMDHGPILAQKKVILSRWPLPADELANSIVRDGGELLAQTILELIKGTIIPQEQNHTLATYTKKIVKEDGRIDLQADPYKNWLAYNAYKSWPGSFFFIEQNGKKTRITITDAVFENGQFIIKKIIPEGKKEVSWKGSVI